MPSMTQRLSTWLVDTAARRPAGWIGRFRFGGARGAPRDHEATFDVVLECAGSLRDQCCLDLGCGGGRLLERMLQADARVAAGLDHSPEMIAVTRARNADAVARGRLDLKIADAAAMPWANAVFDVVLCANVFFFVSEPERVLAEILRVLRPGGRLVLATAEGPLPRVSLRYWSLYLWGHVMHVHTDSALRAMLERAGFAAIRIQSRRGLQLAFGIRPE